MRLSEVPDAKIRDQVIVEAGSRVRVWLSLPVKLVNQFGGVFQEFRGFPAKFVVTNPVNKIFQSFADKFQVKYLFDLEFNAVVDEDWRWGRLFLSNEGVASCGIKKRYVENWMTFHGNAEVQLISVAGYFFG